MTWHKGTKKWEATIGLNGRHIYLGIYKDEIEAAKAYDKAASQYHGQYARLNIPTAKAA